MLKNNILNIFLYLRKIFNKSSKYEYQRFFFERNNKIKRLCISLGLLFSSSQWTTKVSNSVVENLIEDKIDLEFLILKYKYSSTVQYDSYVKLFYKTQFLNKNIYIRYIRSVKYIILLLLSLLFFLLITSIFTVITSTTNIGIFYNKIFFYIWSYLINPINDLFRLSFFFVPVYVYVYLLNYFTKTSILKTRKNSSFRKFSNIILYTSINQPSFDLSSLFLLKKLLKLVNLLNESSTIESFTLFSNRTPLLPLLSKFASVDINRYYLTLTQVSWLIVVDKLYSTRTNFVSLKNDLNNYTMFILNDIQNNSSFKNDRWLYKFSLLTPKVTSFLHKIAEQKNLIIFSQLNELPFSSNLWLKNIKSSIDNSTFYFNLLNNMSNNLINKNPNLVNLSNNLSYESKQHLTYLEESLQFLYKRFYLFNSIDSNIYTKTFNKKTFSLLSRSDTNIYYCDSYDFVSSIKKPSNYPNPTLTPVLNNSNFSSESKFMYYISLLDILFTYNIYFTCLCLTDSTDFWLNSKPLAEYVRFKKKV